MSAFEAASERISALSKSPFTIFTFGYCSEKPAGMVRSKTVISYSGCWETKV